jgi:hypothetical protein
LDPVSGIWKNLLRITDTAQGKKMTPDLGSGTATLLKSHLMIQSLRVTGEQILSNKMQQKKNKFLNLAKTLQGIPSKHWPA